MKNLWNWKDPTKSFCKKNKETIIARNVIAERENRIQSIFEAAPDAVITLDQHGNITNWNAEAETVFGWTKDEVLEKICQGLSYLKDFGNNTLTG